VIRTSLLPKSPYIGILGRPVAGSYREMVCMSSIGEAIGDLDAFFVPRNGMFKWKIDAEFKSRRVLGFQKRKPSDWVAPPASSTIRATGCVSDVVQRYNARMFNCID